MKKLLLVSAVLMLAPVVLRAASPESEKYCKLALEQVLKGEQQTTKEGKREAFGKGIEYAEKAIEADPSNPDAYMWHCANVGRECQTRSLMEQASALPKMTKDLTAILDKLGCVNYSPAWQALAEIYFNHPMRSNDAALNFMRKSLEDIPSGESRLSSYLLFAQKLSDRGWSASKRASTAEKNRTEFNGKHSSNIDKYTYYDGAGSVSPWSGKRVSAMSDKEEAVAVLEYAIGIYKSKGQAQEKSAFELAVKLLNKLK